MKKLINISLWVIFVLGTFVTLRFVQTEQKNKKANRLQINVSSEDENYFVTRDDIRQMLIDRGDSIVHQPLSTINVPALSRLIANNPSVETAEVFVSVNGLVKITASQRKPIARVFNLSGETYYMDQDGKLMPWSPSYTAPVLAVTGFVNESYGNWYKYSVRDIEAMAPMKEYSVLDDIYRIADFINKDAGRRALIAQIYVNSSKEYELVSRVGTFQIILGSSTDLDEKFSKLMIFCKEGLRNTGAWNAYSSINLKYKNQIVCTKRI